MTSTYFLSGLGGIMIGLSAGLFLLVDGRIAGISGIAAGLMRTPTPRWMGNALFVFGLALGPILFRAIFNEWPVVRVEASTPLMAIGGLLVGFGTRLGSGCTSGHGVCGLARLSPRSMAAVATFLGTGVLTVALERWLT